MSVIASIRKLEYERMCVEGLMEPDIYRSGV